MWLVILAQQVGNVSPSYRAEIPSHRAEQHGDEGLAAPGQVLNKANISGM